MIIPVTEETERIERYKAVKYSSCNATLFTSYLKGLECLRGKKILEIGGIHNPEDNFANFFVQMGANYHTMGLEKNNRENPYVLPVQDFRDLPASTAYDVIISMGVFEEFGIDQSTDGLDLRSFYHHHLRDLQKLHSLTSLGGINIIGTISDPCFYTNDEIQEAGFKLQHRIKQFASLGSESHEARRAYKDSELLVMEK